ncbi:TonB-dependent receptor [Neolewinella aurantiaca]|nr:hypothetical protein [Neolewinella aurantiaca]
MKQNQTKWSDKKVRLSSWAGYFLPLLLSTLTPLLAQDTLSFGGIYDLPGAEVRASYTPVSPLAQSFTIEEVYRLPGTFYDPARLVALLPGVVQTNDQANHLSVRGNTPNANLWRLNGLAIVNPNHTANAGTFYDFPTLSGGGVNAISAQMLGNSGFLAGGLPVEYGFATGGTFDLRLRPGSKTRRKYQAQAGFIGFDLMAEGPIGDSGKTSYLVNGRYSFTGLLADMGVDFGGEEIRFYDINAHLDHTTEKGRIGAFAIFGNSTNDFLAPDPAESEITEQKELFDIEFSNDLAVMGFDFDRQIGGGTLSGGYAFSDISAFRDQYFRMNSPAGRAVQTNNLSRNNANLKWRETIGRNGELTIGAEYLRETGGISYVFEGGSRDIFQNGGVTADAVSPFVSYKMVTGPYALEGGLRYSFYSASTNKSIAEPRLRITRRGDVAQVTLAAEINSQRSLAAGYTSSFGGEASNVPAVATQQVSLAYGRSLGKLNTRITLFGQRTPEELAASALAFGPEEFLVSANNLLEIGPDLTFDKTTTTRRYGVELEAGGGRKSEGWYYRGNLTLLRAETEQLDGSWSKDRYSSDFITKLTVGREWEGQDKKERVRTYGLNLALIAYGGERYGETPLFEPSPTDDILLYFAGQDLRNGFINSTGTYFRPDLRLYKTKIRPKTTTTLALDLQNVAGIENLANVYYDAFLEQPNERYQLGLIPVLSYRVVWR